MYLRIGRRTVQCYDTYKTESTRTFWVAENVLGLGPIDLLGEDGMCLLSVKEQEFRYVFTTKIDDECYMLHLSNIPPEEVPSWGTGTFTDEEPTNPKV